MLAVSWGANLRVENRNSTSSPLVTIITVVYNGIEDIEKTINSVFSLKNKDIEYIVIDGGSTDGTAQLLFEKNEKIDLLLSEKDKGIYDAMNKGIKLARGHFVYHLNVGDEIIHVPLDLLKNIPNKFAGLAACVCIDGLKIFKPSFGLSLRMHNTIHHQGCFYRVSDDLIYDTKYRVFSDFDLNQKISKSGKKFFINDDVVVASHAQGGISHNAFYFKEVYEIINKNYGLFWVFLSFFYFKIMGVMKKIKFI